MANKPAFPGSPLPKKFDASNTDPKTGKPRKQYAAAREAPPDKPSLRKPLVKATPPPKAPTRALTDKEKLKQKQNTLPASTRRALEKEGLL